MRDLPVDFTVLLENVVDFDHGPFAHQSLGFDLYSGRGLHSSTFRLIISAFCGIRWVVHGRDLVTQAAQVELRSGRV